MALKTVLNKVIVEPVEAETKLLVGLLFRILLKKNLRKEL